MVEIKKIPPLRCSNCNSTRVSTGRGIVCEDCGMVEVRGELKPVKPDPYEILKKFRRGWNPKVDGYE